MEQASKSGLLSICVGRTPSSARVPLDPLLAQSVMPTENGEALLPMTI